MSSLSTTVEFFLSVGGIPRLDLMSKSDPFAVVLVRRGTQWDEIGRTETHMDTHACSFKHRFVMDYLFEEVQPVRVEVYDRDAESENLQRHDHIGTADFTLGKLMGSRGQAIRLTLTKAGADRGTLVVHGEEVAQENATVDLDLEVLGLPAKRFGSRRNPRVLIRRGDRIVWETPVLRSTLNPKWPVFRDVPVQTLCNGDRNRSLRIECWDERPKQSKCIGFWSGSFNDMLRTTQVGLNKRETSKKRLETVGVLHLVCVLHERPTFLQYLRGGCEVSLMVGIDYTQSNRDPSDPRSLHYQGSGTNPYQEAIRSVGDILQEYDHDGLFPVYGFGGRPQGCRLPVSHCFAVNGSESAPDVEGVNGILQVYTDSLQRVSLKGPTRFSDLIRRCTRYCPHATQDEQKYTILLLLTDGLICDMRETVDAILDAADKPISIVIVGVGNADFEAMYSLDADYEPLTSGDRTMQRDIVQFVPFNEFKHSPALLAKETLAEIPGQFLEYMASRGIRPKPPVVRGASLKEGLVPAVPMASPV